MRLVEEDCVVRAMALDKEESNPPSDTFYQHPPCLMTQEKLDQLRRDFNVDDDVRFRLLRLHERPGSKVSRWHFF